MMRLSGSVKLRCALGSGSSVGGAAGLPGFLRPSALRCCSFSASMRRSSSAASLASASSAAIASWIFASLFSLSLAQSGISSPRLIFAEGLVLFGIRRLGGRQHASDLRFQFRLAFLHAFIAHRFMFRRVRFYLRAIQCDVAESDQPCCLTQL